jgi:2-phosphosulfolactate phosphatase
MQRASISTCGQATGTVVVIDVLRAFTTAAYAFAAGAKEILLASEVQEAFELQRQYPGYLLMGEMGGLPIPGFDFSNSPVAISQADLHGRGLIQRTSAGTQGVIHSSNATRLLAASFCVAKATAQALKLSQPDSITFVITGAENVGGGDEDAACADYIEALLMEEYEPDIFPYLERVRYSTAGEIFSDPQQPEFPEADLEFSLLANRFDFAMEAERRAGVHILHPRW